MKKFKRFVTSFIAFTLCVTLNINIPVTFTKAAIDYGLIDKASTICKNLTYLVGEALGVTSAEESKKVTLDDKSYPMNQTTQPYEPASDHVKEVVELQKDVLADIDDLEETATIIIQQCGCDMDKIMADLEALRARVLALEGDVAELKALCNDIRKELKTLNEQVAIIEEHIEQMHIILGNPEDDENTRSLWGKVQKLVAVLYDVRVETTMIRGALGYVYNRYTQEAMDGDTSYKPVFDQDGNLVMFQHEREAIVDKKTGRLIYHLNGTIEDSIDDIERVLIAQTHRYRVAHMYSLNSEFPNVLWNPHSYEVPLLTTYAEVIGQFAATYTGYWDTSISTIRNPGNATVNRALEILGYDAVVRREGVFARHTTGVTAIELESPTGESGQHESTELIGEGGSQKLPQQAYEEESGGITEFDKGEPGSQIYPLEPSITPAPSATPVPTGDHDVPFEPELIGLEDDGVEEVFPAETIIEYNQELIPEYNITWLDAVTVLYKALGEEQITYTSYMTYNPDIVPEASPVGQNLSNISLFDGYDYHTFVSRSNKIEQDEEGNLVANNIYWTKAVNDGVVQSSVIDEAITVSEFYILASRLMQAYGEPVINDSEIQALLQVYGSSYPIQLGTIVADAWAYLKVRGVLDEELKISATMTRNQLLDICMRIKDEDSRTDYKNIQVVLDLSDVMQDDYYYPVEDFEYTESQFSSSITYDYANALCYDYLIYKGEGADLGQYGELVVSSTPEYSDGTAIENAYASNTYIEIDGNTFYVVSIPKDYSGNFYISRHLEGNDAGANIDCIKYIEVPSNCLGGGFFMTLAKEGDHCVVSNDGWKEFNIRSADERVIGYVDYVRAKEEKPGVTEVASNASLKERLEVAWEVLTTPMTASAFGENVFMQSFMYEGSGSAPSTATFTPSSTSMWKHQGTSVEYKKYTVCAIPKVNQLYELGLLDGSEGIGRIVTVDPNYVERDTYAALSRYYHLKNFTNANVAWKNGKYVSASTFLTDIGKNVNMLSSVRYDTSDSLLTPVGDVAFKQKYSELIGVANQNRYGDSLISYKNTGVENILGAVAIGLAPTQAGTTMSPILQKGTSSGKAFIDPWNCGVKAINITDTITIQNGALIGLADFYELHATLPARLQDAFYDTGFSSNVKNFISNEEDELLSYLLQSNCSISYDGKTFSLNSQKVGSADDILSMLGGSSVDKGSANGNEGGPEDITGTIHENIASTVIMNRTEQILISWTQMLETGAVINTFNGGVPLLDDNGNYSFMTKDGMVEVNNANCTITIGSTLYDMSNSMRDEQGNFTNPLLYYVDTSSEDKSKYELYFDYRCIMGVCTNEITYNENATAELMENHVGAGSYAVYDLKSNSSNIFDIVEVNCYNFPEVPGEYGSLNSNINGYTISAIGNTVYDETEVSTGELYWDESYGVRLAMTSFVPTSNWINVISYYNGTAESSVYVYYLREPFVRGYLSKIPPDSSEEVQEPQLRSGENGYEDDDYIHDIYKNDYSNLFTNIANDTKTDNAGRTLADVFSDIYLDGEDWNSSADKVNNDMSWYDKMTMDAIWNMYRQTGTYVASKDYVIRRFVLDSCSAADSIDWMKYNGTEVRGVANEPGMAYWVNNIGMVYNVPDIDDFSLEAYLEGRIMLPLAAKNVFTIYNYNMNYYGKGYNMDEDNRGYNIDIPYGYVLTSKGFKWWKDLTDHPEVNNLLKPVERKNYESNSDSANSEYIYPFEITTDSIMRGKLAFKPAPVGIYIHFHSDVDVVNIGSLSRVNTEINRLYLGTHQLQMVSSSTQDSGAQFSIVSEAWPPVIIPGSTAAYRVHRDQYRDTLVMQSSTFVKGTTNDVKQTTVTQGAGIETSTFLDGLVTNKLIEMIDEGSSWIIFLSFTVLPMILICIMTILIGLSFLHNNKFVLKLSEKLIDPVSLLTLGHTNLTKWNWKKVLFPCILLYVLFALFLNGNIIRIVQYVAEWYGVVLNYFTR